jgi:hypothetical protein
VVLPQPFDPTKPILSPFSIRKEAFSKRVLSPKPIERAAAEMRAINNIL